MFIILFSALISLVCSYPWNEHENTCLGTSNLGSFLQLCKSAIKQSPKGEPVLYFEEMRRIRSGQLTPFKQRTTWGKLFQNVSPTLRVFIQKGLEKTEEIFAEIRNQLKKRKKNIVIKLDLTIFKEGRKALVKEWPHLQHQSPADLSQAVACYCLSHYPYVRVINLKERPNKQKALGWGVRATVDIPALTLLVGYQGLEHVIGDLDDDLLVRIRQVNEETMDAEYTLTVDDTDYLIEGAPAVALYHEKRVTLSDKSTKVFFCLGPLVNGSPNANVEWSQIELDGQPLVMFYAKRRIGKGQELFVNYGEEYMNQNQIN